MVTGKYREWNCQSTVKRAIFVDICYNHIVGGIWNVLPNLRNR